MKKGQLIAKLFIFTAGMVWMLLFLYICIVCFDFFREVMFAYGEIDLDNWFMTVLETWYLLTCIASGIWLARRMFLVVGEWQREKVNGNGNQKSNS